MNDHFIEEWFPVVDEDGNTIGSAPRSVCHDGKSMLLHPVVHLHVFNTAGELFLQKRSANKDIQPGKWDTSVGGHVSPGETPGMALVREAREEINVCRFEPHFLYRYIWESEKERELVSTYYTVVDKVDPVSNDEIEDGRFWETGMIREKSGSGIFTPNFEKEFSMLIALPDGLPLLRLDL